MKLGNIFKKVVKQEEDPEQESNVVAKERLQLVLMQDRANVSAEFLEMMKNEIVSVVQKYIDVDEEAMDIRLTTEPNEDGTNGIPKIYANIPIIQIKNESKFGRLQIQNAYGEVISEIGGNKEPSKFAEVNEGEIFAEGEDEEDIEIKGTIIDRKEDVEEDNSTPVKEDNKTQIVEDSQELLEDVIDELEEYDEDEEYEDNDDDVTFDDLLKAAEDAEKNQSDELAAMKSMISKASNQDIQNQEIEEDSLLQRLSDIDEDEGEHANNPNKHASKSYNSNYKKNKKKKR